MPAPNRAVPPDEGDAVAVAGVEEAAGAEELPRVPRRAPPNEDRASSNGNAYSLPGALLGSMLTPGS